MLRPVDDDAPTPDEERERREAVELESFERRAEWSRLHYGIAPEEADERARTAVEHAEAMPQEDDPPPDGIG